MAEAEIPKIVFERDDLSLDDATQAEAAAADRLAAAEEELRSLERQLAEARSVAADLDQRALSRDPKATGAAMHRAAERITQLQRNIVGAEADRDARRDELTAAAIAKVHAEIAATDIDATTIDHFDAAVASLAELIRLASSHNRTIAALAERIRGLGPAPAVAGVVIGSGVRDQLDVAGLMTDAVIEAFERAGEHRPGRLDMSAPNQSRRLREAAAREQGATV